MWLSESLLVGCNQYFSTWGRDSKSFFTLVRSTLPSSQRIPVLGVRTTLHIEHFLPFCIIIIKVEMFGVLLLFFFFLLFCFFPFSPPPRLWLEENMQPGNLGQETWVTIITISRHNTVFSIKPVEQLAMFYNSCANCCLTSSDYSSDTFKNKLVNSAGFRGPFRVCGRGVGLWGRRVFDRNGLRGGSGWRPNDPRKMLSC